jgi:hypothetical protein
MRAYLSVVDTNDGSDHLGYDDHVSQVCLYGSRLLVWLLLLLCLSQFLDEAHSFSA